MESALRKERSDLLMHFRLAYLGDAWVNWCPALGTVLANDEVKDGVPNAAATRSSASR